MAEPTPERNAPSLQDLIERRFTRREWLAGAIAVGAMPGLGAPASDASTLKFAEPANRIIDGHAVAEGYSVDVLLRWGDPTIGADAPEFDPEKQTAETQRKQFGTHNDFIACNINSPTKLKSTGTI